MVRGIEGRDRFGDNEDKDNFVEFLGDIIKDTETSCFACSLMRKRVLLLFRTGDHLIVTVMRRLLAGYAVSFNRRYNSYGYFSQNIFKSILFQEYFCLMELVRYIHLNSLSANIMENYTNLGRYTQCNHIVVMGTRRNDWQNVDYLLEILSIES
jgi:hypothetical protein